MNVVLLNEYLNGIWLIRKESADVLTTLVMSEIESKEDKLSESKVGQVDSVLTLSFDAKDKLTISESARGINNIPENSLIVIPISGIITKANQDWSLPGTQSMINSLQAYDKNENVIAIILKIDSPGGEGYAAMNMAEAIRNMEKPVIAFVDDMAASAAYWIASATRRISSNSKMTVVGSIGTYITIVDYRGYYEKNGFKIQEIYAKSSKDKNLEYRQAIDGKPEGVQARASEINDVFLNAIGENRGDSLKKDMDTWGTGKVFYAKDALKIGLVDEIMTFKEMLNDVIYNVL